MTSSPERANATSGRRRPRRPRPRSPAASAASPGRCPPAAVPLPVDRVDPGRPDVEEHLPGTGLTRVVLDDGAGPRARHRRSPPRICSYGVNTGANRMCSWASGRGGSGARTQRGRPTGPEQPVQVRVAEHALGVGGGTDALRVGEPGVQRREPLGLEPVHLAPVRAAAAPGRRSARPPAKYRSYGSRTYWCTATYAVSRPCAVESHRSSAAANRTSTRERAPARRSTRSSASISSQHRRHQPVPRDRVLHLAEPHASRARRRPPRTARCSDAGGQCAGGERVDARPSWRGERRRRRWSPRTRPLDSSSSSTQRAHRVQRDADVVGRRGCCAWSARGACAGTSRTRSGRCPRRARPGRPARSSTSSERPRLLAGPPAGRPGPTSSVTAASTPTLPRPSRASSNSSGVLRRGRSRRPRRRR